jgi:hypothetical protein
MPEFRRCAMRRCALSLRHENINSESFREQRISYRSTPYRNRRGSSTGSRVWGCRPRCHQSGFGNWLSVPALSALGKAWRVRHSIPVRFDPARSSVFRDRTDFVHAEACQRYSATDEYPADFRNGRAFRAYDADYNMIDAQVVNGNNPEAAIEKLFRNPKIEFVDARSVTHGCFTFRIRGSKD